MPEDRLESYHAKRDLDVSPEPAGGLGGGGLPLYVIQKHDARALHYDFRIEVDDVLASWAVPKGPSTDPKVRRLALRTEDHPMDYADFEGVIPEMQYGAGPVIVWDRGTYRNLMAEKDTPWDMQESLERGHVEIWLEGEKLRGGYTFVRIEEEPREQWLLIKMKDAEADASRDPVRDQTDSVLSGRSLEQVRDQSR